MMNIAKQQKYLKLAKENNQMEFLYEITKTIAENDSIGEWYSYHEEYTHDDFKKEKSFIKKGETCSYSNRSHGVAMSGRSFLEVGLSIYRIALNNLG